MKTKELGVIARSVSEMAVSSRINGNLDDVANFEKGSIHIDILEKTASDTNVGEISIPITTDLYEWFRSRKLLLYSLTCNSIIRIQRREFTGHSRNKIWYHRNA